MSINVYLDLEALVPSGLIHLRDALDESGLEHGELLAAIHSAYEANMGEHMPAPAYLSPKTAAIAALQNALVQMAFVSGELPEIIEHVSPMPAEIIGQIIMQHLPIDAVGFPLESKQYWMAVAHHMGPDWIAALRKVAAFMDKMESF